MLDFYIANPHELRGKPKATIADYVGQNGILVPRRFVTLDDALSSGIPIIARSEHPQDYDGVSGLLHSPTLIHGKKVSEDEIIKKILAVDNLKRGGRRKYKFQYYCFLAGIDEKEFANSISYSLWEKISGHNLTIIADSGVPERWYVFASDEKGHIQGIKTHGNGKPINLNFPPDLDLQKIIEFYENVRSLGRFDPNHCPIIEAQYHNGKIYFLQYTRTQDFSGANFKVDMRHEEGYMVAFVRGTTPEKGLTIIVKRGDDSIFDDEGRIIKGEYGLQYPYIDDVVLQIGAHQRPLDLSSFYPNVLHNELRTKHCSLAQMFKPKLSVALHPRDEAQKYESLVKKHGIQNMPKEIIVFVKSDGDDAVVKFIES